MPISSWYGALRQKVGHDLLLIPAVAAVVHDAEGRVLIQERPEGGFSLPASAIEPGEQPAQAVAREVYEETGLTVRPMRLLGVFGVDRVTYPNGDLVEYQVSLFGCEIVGGALRCLDGESVALRFYGPEAIPPLGTEYPRHLLVRKAQGLAFQWEEQWLRSDGVKF